MSSASSAVIYTFVYTDSKPCRVFWGADEEISDGGSPRVIILGYNGLPIQPVSPPSPDYIPGPKEPHTPPVPQDEDVCEPMFIQPHDPDYVPEPIYPEYIPLEDEHEFLVEEQSLPPVDSPTAESPGYVVESDPKEDPKEYEDDETKDGPVNYPMDGGEDGDDDDDDSSGDDANDDDDDDDEARDGRIMVHVTRRGPNTSPNNTNPNNITPESVQAMIDQALLRYSTNRDGSHRTEGVVGLTRWIEKMELVFNISGCAIENQSARPKMLDETIELANDLMDQKLRTYAERHPDNKRKADDSSRNNHGHQQQPFKRQHVAKVYNMGTSEKKPYGGSLPKCTKCHFHHNGPCTQRCNKCNKVGHFARDCRSSSNTNVANTQKGNGENPKGNGCFECGASGHFKRDCPKLKSKDGGNGNAQGWVYAVGNAEKNGNASRNPDSNVVTGTFFLNNRYASILLDIGADRSFISTAFSSLINIAPTLLENSYDVELVDGKIVGIDTIIRG
ncbi:putative reverse transcriptase domain-containing protein, partial [Tanacetum coccineum]